MAYRYYLTQRPPMPGAVPNKPENRLLLAKETGPVAQVVYKPVVVRSHGYVEYDKPLSTEEVEAYELTPGKAECNGCKYQIIRGERGTPCRDCSRFPAGSLPDRYQEMPGDLPSFSF